ncbi:MAG: ATP-binding cassette domain-containing protein [Planctomycetes bacterium]|nr:ATP-binding cassette domain-containing protein [Planctomycetota bacterium]
MNRPAVEIEHLTVVRGQTTILSDVSCIIPYGECTVLLGPNGCGKTTLTRVITGQSFITAGRALVLGEEIGETDVRALRRRIGVVNPTAGDSHAANSGAVVDAELTSVEVVLTGIFGTIGLYERPTAEQVALADHHLQQVGLGHRRDLRFALLSTGEQRRCMIARALTTSPELLILDEPTAGMDIAGREQVLATVERLLARPNPPAVLMITHHVEEMSPRTGTVMLMRGGRIIAKGKPQEIITPESLTATFGCKVFVKKLHGRYWLEVLPEAWLELLPKDGKKNA